MKKDLKMKKFELIMFYETTLHFISAAIVFVMAINGI